jgi:hypothetical protein
MLHGILKEHKVHHSINLIVALKGLLQYLVERLPGCNGEVLGLPSHSMGKVAIDKRLLPDIFHLKILRREKRINSQIARKGIFS